MIQLRKNIMKKLEDFNKLRIKTQKDLTEEENDEAQYNLNEFYVMVQPKLRVLKAIGTMGLVRHKFREE